MSQSLTYKLFGRFVLTIVAVSVLILFFSYESIRSFVIESNKKELFDYSRAIESDLSTILARNNNPALNSFIVDLGRKLLIRITVIAPDGVVLADSQHDPQTMENHRDRQEFMQALQLRQAYALHDSNTLKQKMIYTAIPIMTESKVVAVLRLSKYLHDLNSMIYSLLLNIFKSVVIILVLAFIFAYFFSEKLLRPVKELCIASGKVAGGDLTARVLLKVGDEYQELGENFNIMTSRLQRNFSELSQQQQELNGIISSMQEGLLAVNRKGEVVLMNDSFCKMFNTTIPVGKYYAEAFLAPALNEMINAIRKDRTNFVKEIEYKEHWFVCSFTFLAASENIILICHDMTELRKLEKIKKDFVINVSHELKTPLTSIKGYLELLADEAPPSILGYVDKLQKNTDRLIQIVQDLLVLASLEAGALPVNNPVNMTTMLGVMPALFEQQMKGKPVVLEVIAQPGCVVSGDEFLLEQALINLIDNAIKYTDQGQVRVAAYVEHQQVVIRVTDTGVGIPTEHQERIFERFYVVDKSRSRKVGGTGLGLSIVKHIINTHNGTLNVFSTPGQGSEFTVFLPRLV